MNRKNYFLSIIDSATGATGTTVAGFSTSAGSSLSQLSNPNSIALEPNGTLYILDTNNYRVMKYLPGEPLGFPVAGSGVSGTTLDRIGTSYNMALDQQSNIYVSESSNHRVTKWTAGSADNATIVCILI